MSRERAVLCDSSSIITLVDSCLGGIFNFLGEKTGVDFFITPGVKSEIIDRPLSIKMKAYQLSALRMKRMLEEGKLNMINAETSSLTDRIMKLANNMFFIGNKPIHLIDWGETDLIATAELLNIDVLLVDERTTRMLIEAPFRIKEHLEEELNTSIGLNEPNFRDFEQHVKGIRVIRSVELIGVAYERGFFDDFKEDRKRALEAALYKAKYSGCSVRFDEIEKLLRIIG